MPFARPTLTQLRDQAIQDITTSGVPGLDGLLRNAVLRVLSWVMSGLAYAVYGYLDWIARMGVPFTAQDEFLQSWAALIGVYAKEATPATGSAQFTGTSGLVIPSGSALTRQDGAPYETTADGTVAAGVVSVPFVSLVFGEATNCDAGTPMSIASPIAGINSGGITVGPTVGGTDQESDAELRTRMLFKYRNPPQGGAVADYVTWALEVPGCTRAWIAPNGNGNGTVVVYPMFDETEIAHGGFPQGTNGVATDETRHPPAVATGDQLLVANHIFPIQPVTAQIEVRAPTPLAVNVTLAALDPNTAAMQAAILASLRDMFLLQSEVAGTLYPSDFYHAILATQGIEHFSMSAPSAAVTAGVGQLPVMGTLTVV